MHMGILGIFFAFKCAELISFKAVNLSQQRSGRILAEFDLAMILPLMHP